MSDRFLRTLAQFGLHNMRGSDEATELLIAGTVKALAEEVGMLLPSLNLSHGCPSRRTLARGEKRLAVDVLLSVVQEIIDDGAEYMSLMVDHGKRSGIEHFVKILSWAALDKDGNRIIKYFCLDVDMSNHSAKDCASAIKLSLNKLTMAGLDLSKIKVFVITGDSGGGGAVQNIHPPLKAIKVMSDESKYFNYQCHALSRGLQVSCEMTFGKQGIGQTNIFQAIYVYVKMLKVLHEDGGSELLDVIHSLVIEKIVDSTEWQMEASTSNETAFEETWSRLMAAPEDDGMVDAITELSTSHAKNIKMPKFARWMTIFPAMELFISNWTIIYFIAVALKQSRPSTSSLVQYASTLLGLMNTGSGPPGTKVTDGQVPPLYAEGLFVLAFGKAYFVKHFEWLLRRDPEFGR